MVPFIAEWPRKGKFIVEKKSRARDNAQRAAAGKRLHIAERQR
jgi:hypothetical protein